MNVTYEKKNAMTFIGYHAEIRPDDLPEQDGQKRSEQRRLAPQPQLRPGAVAKEQAEHSRKDRGQRKPEEHELRGQSAVDHEPERKQKQIQGSSPRFVRN